MTPAPRPRKLTNDDLHRSLAFWEAGPLRKILELEFDLVLDEELLQRGVTASADVCGILHDAVVPEVFLFLTENIPWTAAEERRLTLSLVHQHAIHGEIRRRLSVQLDRLGSSLGSAKRKVREVSSNGTLSLLSLLPQEQ
jgi:hypothetical protein